MYFVHPQIPPVKCLWVISSLAKLFNGVKLNNRLKEMFPGKQLVFTDMGRSAFKIIIEKLNLRDSEILMPAYICDIFKPILERYGIKPIFLDIDLRTFHVKIDEIEKKITPDTKAILICHTYGLPFNVETIRISNNSSISKLLLIEDCAHAFGIKPKSGIAFFSLYKQFPTLRGGLLVCPKDWEVGLPKTSFNFRDFISLLNCFSPSAFIFKKFGKDIAPKMTRKEKSLTPAGLNKLSLNLFSHFFEDFEKSLPSRISLAKIFQSELRQLGFEVQDSADNFFCYLSALVPKNLEEKRDEIVEKLRKYRIFCTRIWHTPIVLDEKEFPNTFEAAKRIINFPLQNHYAEKDLQKIIIAVREVISSLSGRL